MSIDPDKVRPNIDHIVTEDDTPLDLYSDRQRRLLAAPLYAFWRFRNGNRKFVAMTNVGLFVVYTCRPWSHSVR